MKQRRLVITKAASRTIRRLPLDAQKAIAAAIEAYAAGDMPNADVVKLHGRRRPEYRLRVGDYRVIYELTTDVIVLRRILDRKDRA